MFVSRSAEDPVLRRSDRLIRFGSALPVVGIFPAMVLLRVFHGSKQELEVIAGLLALGGQAAVWVAMDGLRRTQGWASGVLFYLFAGGLLTSMMVYLTGIPLLMLVPWVAPLTALVAKKRMLHRNHAAGEVR